LGGCNFQLQLYIACAGHQIAAHLVTTLPTHIAAECSVLEWCSLELEYVTSSRQPLILIIVLGRLHHQGVKLQGDLQGMHRFSLQEGSPGGLGKFDGISSGGICSELCRDFFREVLGMVGKTKGNLSAGEDEEQGRAPRGRCAVPPHACPGQSAIGNAL
jgi:hypothetical protein